MYRAIEAVGCEIGFRGGVHARLEKKIPVARGLGGGSSDAASAMIGMLRLTRREKERSFGTPHGNRSGGWAPTYRFSSSAAARLAVNRGDEIYPLADVPKQTIVVVSPRDIGVATKDAYEWLSAGN